MASVCAMGAAGLSVAALQQEFVGLRKEMSSASAIDSVAVGARAGRSSHGIRAQQVQNRPPVRPAVSFPLYPSNMTAYSGVSGQTTVPLVPFMAQKLETPEDVQKGRAVPIPAMNIVMRLDLDHVMERRW
ncbi:hypothetical protein MPTK1_7g02590 [Marchantia polymorpha subsp. ruderalis]|uniref:Uncharacterized protein n=2 Tax=Marchantia polymorpha TaxID=3197 RepID=A0AAF6BVF4_MARPO|nr:hypothetical protein MARPO_0088s0029 [Marchantia polymorpha]BBN15988.1 hypothetical protein Mp_7g02590 [Marchantia polymorpha subsp. ruderalis]|eukprot:PTQ33483.1 hypothetical protein MARPO_0088s0029 [Marchantia polymorpha]